MSTQTRTSRFGGPDGVITLIAGVLTLVALLLVVAVSALSLPTPGFLSISGLAIGAVIFWIVLIGVVYGLAMYW